jgi:hypothetical protein
MKTIRALAPRARTVLHAATLALLVNVPAAYAQTTDTWSLGKSGLWSVAGNWSAGIPNNGTPTGASYNVDIIDGTSTVTLNTTAAIDGLTVGSGNTLAIDTGNTLSITGPTISNKGSIQLNGGGGAFGILDLSGNVTLSGSGTLTLATAASGSGAAYIQEEAEGVTLTNKSTIQGSGIIGSSGLTLVNSGTIDANTLTAGGLLLNGSGGITNTGLIEATNGGELTISSTSASGLTNSGTLQVSSGAVLQVTNGPFTNFSGTTLSGGTYSVSGTLQIDELGTAGGEIVTNAANIILDGIAAKFVDADGNSALSNLALNTAKGSFTLSGDADFTTAGNFNNKGTLTVGAGSIFDVDGTLSNFSGTTLKGGTFDVAGTLEFAGATIETNDAAITLTGTLAEIVNTTSGKNGLGRFAANEAAGKFTLSGGASFTSAGSVSNAGTFTVGAGSTFTVGGRGVFTQTAGTTTDSGTLTASGGVALSGGSLFAAGTIGGNLSSSGIVTPGASATKTGILTDTGTYTQGAGGSLNIGIGGALATKYDSLSATTAVLGGTLNISELGSFVPAVGSTFKILKFNSVTGTFTTVNGLTINSTEEYTVTYQPTDVLLTVVSTDEGARLTAALQEINAAYAGRNDGMAPRPRLERIRAMDLIKKSPKH